MWDDLKDYLAGLKPGPLKETSQLAHLLARVWDDLKGDRDEGGMSGEKLITRTGSRMEKVEWDPPVLTFEIERHGAAKAGGSTRAALQRWEVDLDQRSATYKGAGRRQLSPMANRVDVEPIADEIVGLIVGRVKDHRIHWLPDGQVRVEMGKIFPDGPPKKTVQGRRTRLRKRLIEMLSEKGWKQEHRNGNTFVKVDPPAK
jgi:hypothetical protein